MKKVYVEDLSLKRKISEGQQSIIYELKDGNILKLFKPIVFIFYSGAGVNLERKISCFDGKKIMTGITEPTMLVYNRNNTFAGYVMNKVEGINYNEYDKKITMIERSDLRFYADKYYRFEQIIRNGNKLGIVFPDFCTCDNIMVGPNGDITLIDYDGLQIKDFNAISISTSLGDEEQYIY